MLKHISTKATDERYEYPDINEPDEPRPTYNRTPFLDNKTHRVVVCGESGCGKTYYLPKLLPHMNVEELVIFCKNPEDRPYKRILNFFKDKEGNDRIPVTVSTEFDPCLLENLNRTAHSVVIFDDVDIPKDCLDIYINLFKRGRQDNVSVILIEQRFFDIEKAIRNNINLLLQFKMPDENDVSRISSIFKGLDTSLLKRCYRECVSNEYNPLVIYPSTRHEALKIRCGMTKILGKFL